jgi:flavin reductase (DIM6/NTAB) family NADH-FMN oxidoreductase RutF
MLKINPADLDHREAHHLLVSLITPRPIAWVSTVSAAGVFNLAPFSCYMSFCLHPSLICLGIGVHRDGSLKDTMQNIESARDFVINVVTEDLAEAMNQTSAGYPDSVSEFREVGLTPVKSETVKSPRVGEAPASLECRLVQVLTFGEGVERNNLVIGEVTLVHVREDLFIDGEVPNSLLKPVGRLTGDMYCRTSAEFEMKRPESGYA